MHYQITTVCSACLVVVVFATVNEDPETYLNLAMRRYEESILKDGQRRAPVQFRASLIQRSHDFKDAKNWTTASVMQLMHLIKNSEAGVSVRQALDKVLAPFTTTTASSSVKFRGARESSLHNNILHFEDHLNAHLPSADISLGLMLNLLLPDKVATWLKNSVSEESVEKLKRMLGQGAYQRKKRSVGYNETHDGTPGSPGLDGKRGRGGGKSRRRNGGRTGDWKVRGESGSDGYNGRHQTLPFVKCWDNNIRVIPKKCQNKSFHR
ncbi:unnamed protein product [Arctia plantaginis]|uniref:Uncharacterized protein n=1 Tax=Arctia plantaginis TaxID=874455 RepID=A0A8S0ZP50_ARCPL|nr:unnamed protein product [Arctia plantaginis]